MYSLRYGTLPIVRATGGLKDTVVQYEESTGAGTGFLFYDATPGAILETVKWAVRTYLDRPKHIEILRRRACDSPFPGRIPRNIMKQSTNAPGNAGSCGYERRAIKRFKTLP